MKDVADATVVDSGFKSAHLVAQVLEGLVNVLYPTYDDTEDNLLQMENKTSQSTQIFPQRAQKMQRILMLMAQMKTQLKITKIMVEATTVPVVVIRSHFCENITDGLMVHEITKIVVVSPRKKATNIHQHLINNSTRVIEIITIAKGKKMPEDVRRIVKDR